MTLKKLAIYRATCPTCEATCTVKLRDVKNAETLPPTIDQLCLNCEEATLVLKLKP